MTSGFKNGNSQVDAITLLLFFLDYLFDYLLITRCRKPLIYKGLRTLSWVQVPLPAPDNDNPNPVPIGDGFGFLVYLEC